EIELPVAVKIQDLQRLHSERIRRPALEFPRAVTEEDLQAGPTADGSVDLSISIEIVQFQPATLRAGRVAHRKTKAAVSIPEVDRDDTCVRVGSNQVSEAVAIEIYRSDRFELGRGSDFHGRTESTVAFAEDDADGRFTAVR